MKSMQMMVLIILCLSLGQTVFAQCPDSIGDWSTSDATMLAGRATEAWCGADGVNSLTGDLSSYHVVATLTIEAGLTVAVTSDITFSGEFIGCPGANGCSMHFEITGAQLAWHPNFGGDMPLNYPVLLCAATMGEAFDVPNITGEITCAVPTEDTSWGTLKALYQ